ncbi:MAG TPA: hypothetical protein VEC01_14100 [Noviherbaspirillum sp.]|uniref:hypothetical protein n=1 Tax=Noviherbaspirillum sp. TaxID=1926288 RepID=UPI002D5DAE18|nr:hypothetical protein [Noviherbaspirillum sp.]HYD96458.1 hypothetical protein [Noviherbaspirillum sp.]
MSTLPSAGAAVGLVVLVATSLTFETTGFSILAVNPALALLLLMGAPDVSLELEAETVVFSTGFAAVAPFGVSGAVLFAAAARAATGTVFLVVAPLALVFAAGPAADVTLLFTVVLPCLAMDFAAVDAVFAAGLRVPETVFASLFATVLRVAFAAPGAAVLPLAGAAVFAAVLLTLFAAALLVADLVTVAFMAPSMNEQPDMLDPCPENRLLPFPGRVGYHRAPRDFSRRILPNDYLHCLNLHQRHCH